jgi:hypothetical protein
MRQEKMDVERARERADAVRRQLADLEARLQEDIDRLHLVFDAEGDNLEAIRIAPNLSDMVVDAFGLAWMPYRRNDQGHLVPDWSGAG